MKWLKGYEVSCVGNYLMCRTDDDITNAFVIQVRLELESFIRKEPLFTITEASGFESPTLDSWDEECRFLGPLPTLDTFTSEPNLIVVKRKE